MTPAESREPTAPGACAPRAPRTLRLLGGFELRRDGRGIALASRKARALLALLAARRGHPVARDTLTSLLWPDTGPQAARQSLRQALLLLRRALGPEATASVDGRDLRLEAAVDLDIDVERFEAAAARALSAHGESAAASAATAARLYRGELLSGAALAGAEPFEEWLAAERSRLRDLADRVLARLDALAERRGDLPVAAQYAERRLHLDDLSETSARRLATLLARSGLRSRALAELDRLAERLAGELGATPEAATLRLAARLREGLPPSEPGPTAASTRFRHLPVLPLLERDAARARLSDLLGRVREGSCALMLIEGPGGSGKTRLARTAIAEGVPESRASILPTCGCAASRPPAESSLARMLAATDPESILGEFATLTCPLGAVARDRPSGSRAPGSGRPVFLLVDDLDALAPLHEEALCRLAARLARLGPVGWLATARQSARARTAPLADRLARELGTTVTRVPLAPLGEDSLDRAARSIVDDDEAEPLVRLFRRATTGLPLELAESLLLLADLEALTRRSDGSWTLDPHAVAAVAARGLQEILDRRLEALPPSARRLLGIAAVAGPCFRLEALARAEGEQEEVAHAALETLVERWFLRPLEGRWHPAEEAIEDGVGPGRPAAGSYEFAQRTTRRLLLGRIPPARRTELARRLEGVGAPPVASILEVEA